MTAPKRRGTRIVTGYVVSLSGKRGGSMRRADGRLDVKCEASSRAIADSLKSPNLYPKARVLPVVRYELDREEERLRDAVVEAAVVALKADELRSLLRVTHNDMHGAHMRLESATRALRAHLEKSK